MSVRKGYMGMRGNTFHYNHMLWVVKFDEMNRRLCVEGKQHKGNTMDEVIEGFKSFLEKMENRYLDLLLKTPDWKLNSFLPQEIHKEALSIRLNIY